MESSPAADTSVRSTSIGALAGLTLVSLVSLVSLGCSTDGGTDGGTRDAVVVPTLPPAATSDDAAAPVANVADVLRAGDAAAAAAGGEVIRTGVDLMGYLVELRQPDGRFTQVQLDIAFGVVFIEELDDVGDRASELAADVDLRRAVELALRTAAGEPIGAAGDGIVVGAELEPDGYDIDIQYPDGRVLEVRLDDTWVVTGTRIRGG